ncbi:MAG: hypothetical protein WD995_03230 [Gemmatimonadota bacterium]
MKALPRYTLVTSLLVVLFLAIAAPFLDAAGRFGLMVAAGVTLPLQIGLFALLVGTRHDSMRFMASWGLGVLGRMLVVGVVGLSIHMLETVDPTVTILSTVGLFFIFLLLEPVFLFRNEQATGYAR